jgi:hypothetical protein
MSLSAPRFAALVAAMFAIALAVNLTGVAAGTTSPQVSATPRIVRGHVNLATGGGQGYSVTHTRTTIGGRIQVSYVVTFATPFSTNPVVVAAPEHTCHTFTRENAETTRTGFKAHLTGCAAFTFIAMESYGP